MLGVGLLFWILQGVPIGPELRLLLQCCFLHGLDIDLEAQNLMGQLCENIPNSYHGKEKVEKKYGVCIYQITNLYELDHVAQLCDEKVYLSQGLCDRCNHPLVR
jgi:hypothetical protein